jgi:hypothetical protein
MELLAALGFSIALVNLVRLCYREYRVRRAYRRGVADARLEAQREVWREVCSEMSVEQLEDLRARLDAEMRRRGEI